MMKLAFTIVEEYVDITSWAESEIEIPEKKRISVCFTTIRLDKVRRIALQRV